MADKIITTRIRLKYDTLENWQASKLILGTGEIAITTVPTGTENSPSTSLPAVLFKCGDGTHTWSELEYTYARSSDVYAWAKAAQKPTYAANEIQNLSTFINNAIKDTDTQYKINISGRTVTLYSKNKDDADTAYKAASSVTIPASTLVEGKTNGTVKFNNTEVKVHGLGSAAYTASSAYATSAQGAKADTAVQSISIGGAAQTKTDGAIDLPAYPTLSSIGAAKATDLTAHTGNTSNPHEVTADQVGLGNVTNAKQIPGLASGTTEDHFVSFGVDGYTVKDSGYTSSSFATAAQGTKADKAMPKSGGTFTGAVNVPAPTNDTNASTKKYVDDQIKANVASVFKFKGTVSDISKLPAAAAGIEGHVYHVTADHGEYVCAKVDGATTYSWEPLSGTIDLSDYALSADVIQRVTDAAGEVPKLKADGTIESTGFTLGKSVPSSAVFTDTKVGNLASNAGKVVTGLTSNTTLATTNVGALALTGFSASTGDTGAIVATDTITKALNKIYNLANSKTNNAGTVTSVKVAGTNGLTGSGTVTSSGTITLKHGAKPTTGTATTNTGRTYIQNITLDSYGHVASVSTATETVTDTGVTDVTANNGLTGTISDRTLTMGISSISTDLLSQGSNVLVFSCGGAS
jgi:hypothetical protein